MNKDNDQYLSDEQAVDDFLRDIACLDRLTAWTQAFNIFDILKITRTEIRHSTMLAWLLDPHENHGLGTKVIDGFLRLIEERSPTSDASTVAINASDFAIRREWLHIDIAALSPKNRYILCIENKIGASEHGDQLARYRNLIQNRYPDWQKRFVLLSPDGCEASDSDHWHSLSYRDALEVIDHAASESTLEPGAKLLIDNYVDALRRYVLVDEKLARTCTEIYTKHKRALDLIFENKPDKGAELAELFRKWAQQKHGAGDIVFDADQCTKWYTRFLTSTMSTIISDTPGSLSRWNSPNHYFWEIELLNENSFFLKLTFCSANMPPDQRKLCDFIDKLEPAHNPRSDWLWRIPFKTEVIQLDEDYTEQAVCVKLDEMLVEAKRFESRLKARLAERAAG